MVLVEQNKKIAQRAYYIERGDDTGRIGLFDSTKPHISSKYSVGDGASSLSSSAFAFETALRRKSTTRWS